MESRYFKKIMSEAGAEEIKALAKQWKTFSQNIGKIPPDLPVLLPEYLLLAGIGSGKSHMIRLLANYLEETGLLLFEGDQKVVEFQLNYTKQGEYFYELGRFEDCIRHAAGYRNRFRGVVLVECSEWVHHFGDRHMGEFLEYLMDHSREWLIFLVVDTNDQAEIDYIRTIISSYFRLHILKLDYPDTPEMVTYMTKRIRSYGFGITAGAKKLLSETLDEIRNEGYFSGYWTMNLITQEILYSIYSSEAGISKTITVKQLGRFAVDGDFTRQMKMQHVQRKPKIGFGGEIR